MNSNYKTRSTAIAVVAALACTPLLAACTFTSGAGSSDHLADISATCAKGASLRLASEDISGSGRSPELDKEHLVIIRDEVTHSAVCGSRFRLTAFSVAAGTTEVLYDDSPELPGATDAARARKLDATVDEVMKPIKAARADAIARVSEKGTDIVATFGQVSDLLVQATPKTTVDVTLITDGMNTKGFAVHPDRFDDSRAAALIETVAVPNLHTVHSMRIIGLGRVNGSVLPSAAVSGLRTLYQGLCEKATVQSCLAVTDYASKW